MAVSGETMATSMSLYPTPAPPSPTALSLPFPPPSLSFQLTSEQQHHEKKKMENHSEGEKIKINVGAFCWQINNHISSLFLSPFYMFFFFLRLCPEVVGMEKICIEKIFLQT
jgi:hypothetical protein